MLGIICIDGQFLFGKMFLNNYTIFLNIILHSFKCINTKILYLGGTYDTNIVVIIIIKKIVFILIFSYVGLLIHETYRYSFNSTPSTYLYYIMMDLHTYN